TILGAGLIGCEFANDLAASGYKVSIIDLADRPLGRLLPEQAAINLKNKLSELDISWYLKQSLKSLDKNDNSYQLTLDDDTIFETDLVLSAIGLRSNTEIASSAGLNTNRGIMINEYLQTSEENIFALGDCAEINGNVLPFVMPIMLGARALAQTLTGSKTEVIYPAMPVAVKTPAHPVVVCPPPMNHKGNWQEEVLGSGIKSVCYDNGQITGFALTGDATEEKQSLVKLM
ncbi:MAG: FAD-dependent oxidoreductase, partial [Gammaproteobacteria bacterium]|nr:FAD-dependent oxidoreductase [Gammaproteobacteria bacterium]